MKYALIIKLKKANPNSVNSIGPRVLLASLMHPTILNPNLNISKCIGREAKN
jgi:hypothetical protein